jgi:AcrR family transcriptional regulator
MPKVSAAHAAERRIQIVEAAARCFERAGIHRTTMQDIFREAGLSPGAVYTYFFGKAEIVRAVAEEVDFDARLAVELWAEALHDPRIMQIVRATAPSARAELLEAALRP